jgi:hypothetical protein
MTVEQIARVAYAAEAERSLQVAARASASFDALPDAERAAYIAHVQFILDNEHAGPAKEYRMLCARKEADGWEYGPTLDEAAKTDPTIVPFEQLPAENRKAAHLMYAIVRVIAAHVDAQDHHGVEATNVVNAEASSDTTTSDSAATA